MTTSIWPRLRSTGGKILAKLGLRDQLREQLIRWEVALGRGEFLGFGLSPLLCHFQIESILAHSSTSALAALTSIRNPEFLFVGLHDQLIFLGWETTIAHGLIQRGRSVEFLICDRCLPECAMAKVNFPKPCEQCFPMTRDIVQSFRLPHRCLSSLVGMDSVAKAERLVDKLSFDRCQEFQYRDIPLGSMLDISLKSYFLQGDLTDDEQTLQAYRSYLATAVVLVDAYERLLGQTMPGAIVMLNGLYVNWNVLAYLAQQRGIHFVTYEMGQVRDSALFTHNAFPYDIDDAIWGDFKEVPLSAAGQAWLDQYLASKVYGMRDQLVLNPQPIRERQAIYEQLDLRSDMPVVAMYTNIAWDSAVLGKEVGFSSLFDWVAETIRYFSEHSTIQLVIRIHPAEMRLLSKSRQRVQDFITQEFPVLPSNIKLVPPDSDLSSHSLLEMSSLVLVYTTTVGLEAATRGKPVVVAGKAHYRGRGFTYDAADKEHYRSLLDELLVSPRINPAWKDYARRYAYFLFGRLMIPMDSLFASTQGYRFQRLDDLQGGRNPVLDRVCTAIEEGVPFILRDRVEI